MSERVWFTVLGPVRAWNGDDEVDLGPRQQRAVLAVLLAHAGQPVGLSEIVDMLWWQTPPDSAVNAVHRCVGLLRRALQPELALREPGRWLTRSSGGYRLHVDENSCDLLHFRDLLAQARAARGREAVDLFTRALDLWVGVAAEGVGAEVREHPVFAALDAEFLGAAREAADAALATHDTQLLPLIERAAVRAPLDESLQARLVLMLAAAGSQTRALEQFERTRIRLSEELGIDPGPELIRARDLVLQRSSAEVTAAAPHPAQLPADVPIFVGRGDELAAAEANVGPGRAVVISSIGGMAGIGKTSFAVHWAHRIAAEYPDGQLYANLRGHDETAAAASPGEVLRRFLEALGVAPSGIPGSLDAQTALYRSELSKRRVLVVLDNARDVAQVRPLLPGAPTCTVIVTSRNRLAGLVAAEAAWPIMLDVFSPAEARELLTSRLGARRVLAEAAAVDRLIAVCAGLPIALTIVAARAATDLDLTLASLAEDVSDAVVRLDGLTTGEPYTDVRALFSWSYRALSPAAARTFRLLGLHAEADISTFAAASLAGMSPDQLAPMLSELTAAALVVEDSGRYTMHDLLRTYARELADDAELGDERAAAVRRVLEYYTHMAFSGDRLLNPVREPIALPPAVDAITLHCLTDRTHALSWFAEERAALLAASRMALSFEFDVHGWRLAWSFVTFLAFRGHWHDQIEVQTLAIDATRRLSDPDNEAYALRTRAYATTRLGLLDDAAKDLEDALVLDERTGNKAGQGYAHLSLGMIWDRRGQHREALRHAQRASHLFQLCGDKRAEANALSASGWEYTQLGDHERARDTCRQALVVFEALGDRAGQSNTWDSLGVAQHQLGEYAEAITCFNNAIDIVREIGDRYGEATGLTHLGDTLESTGDTARADEAWSRALRILDELGHRDADAIQAKLARA